MRASDTTANKDDGPARPRPGTPRGAALLALLLIAACSGGTKTPTATEGPAAVPAPVVDAPPVPRRPRVAFDPRKLSCKALLPVTEGRALLGFPPDLAERANRRDSEWSIVCTHKSALPSQALSFLVSCGKKEAPREPYERLRALHETLAGAQALPNKRGIAATTSHLSLHPYRPCFLQVACRAPVLRPGGVARLAAEIAAAIP